jgi:hypothetical protein
MPCLALLPHRRPADTVSTTPNFIWFASGQVDGISKKVRIRARGALNEALN